MYFKFMNLHYNFSEVLYFVFIYNLLPNITLLLGIYVYFQFSFIGY